MTSLRDKIEKLKDAFRKIGYEEFVKIESAHISGISYINIGDIGLEFIRDIAEEKLKVRTLATCNPACICAEDFDKSIEGAKQREIIELLRKIGVSTWLTCIPYEHMRVRRERYYAWSESSAVAFINSIYDAYTDKLPGPLSLIAAITGEIPKTDIVREEERYPRILIKVYNDRPLNTVESGILGMIIGSKYRGNLEIPYIIFKKYPFKNIEALKNFLAAFATFSNCPLTVIERISINYKKYRERTCTECKLSIDMRDIDRKVREISIISSIKDLDKNSLIILGCPHLSKRSIEAIVSTLGNRYIKASTWLFTSRFNKTSLRSANLKIVYDTCLFVSSYIRFIRSSFEKIYTNSIKQYYYLSKRVKDLEIDVLIAKEIEETLNNVSGTLLLRDV